MNLSGKDQFLKTGFLIGILFFHGQLLAGQECIGINFFDPPNSQLQSYTCWDSNGKSYVYQGGSASFVTCNNAVPVDMSIGTGSLVLQTTLSGGWWNVQFKLDWGHSVNVLRTGENPLLYLRLKWGQIASDADMSIEFIDDQQILNRYRLYAGQSNIYSNQSAFITLSDYVSPSTSWQDVYIPLSHFLDNNPDLDLTRLSILVLHGVGYYSQTNILHIEKMKIIPGIDCEYADMVKINQLGYLPDKRKLAIVSYESGAVSSPPTYFQVIDATTQSVAYQGTLQLKQACSSSWDRSGDIVYHADFTAVTTLGRYQIVLPELGQTSLTFDINAKTMNRAFRDALRFFYHARSGNPIAEPYAEGHPRPTIYANNTVCPYDYNDNDSAKMYDYDPLDQGITTRNVQGGWFDAGDLHLDVHNNLGSLWFLLETLEQFQNKLGPDVLNLPESDGITNDLVWLIQYQLEWLKKMQNSDGSVHFIVYNHSSKHQQQISDVSTGAACILSAIFAKAYPLFDSIPGMESYAADLLTRAELAWTWLQAHPDTYNPTDPDGDTWSYGIDDDVPYRALAAIELYIATGNSTYRDYFETGYNEASDPKPLNAFNGNSYYGYIGLIGGSPLSKGYMDYIETTRPTTTAIKDAITNEFLYEAEYLIYRANCTNYNIPMLMYNDLYWGSSGLLCANACVLLKAYQWTGKTEYHNAAMDVLEWIGGRNPVNRIFITGYGDYLHGTDHYSFYMFDHLDPVPGYLCGNINHHQNWLKYYIQYDWKFYLNIQNAGILEPCIHWQAQMCYLLGYFASDLSRPGDINSDTVIDQADFLALSRAWLTTPAEGRWDPYCDLAIPYDDMVDLTDLAALISQWMSP